MAKMQILAGHEYDVVSPAELDDHFHRVSSKLEQLAREALYGVKPLRLTSGTVTATGTYLPLVLNTAPRSGYVWSIMRVDVGSNYLVPGLVLFRSSSPSDIVMTANLAPDQYSLSKVVGALAASNPHNTYSKGQLMLQAGEFLVCGMFDAGLATKSFSLNVEAIEVPAEMVGKLLI